MVFRKTPAESNPDCHQQVCLFDATGQNTRSLQGLTAGLSTSFVSKMSQSYFQGYSPVVFPASSPYRSEPEPLVKEVKESMQGEEVYVEMRDRFVHPSCQACTGILIYFSQGSVCD